MARAIYDGVAYNVRWILENISELYGFKPDPLRVIGGGARGLPWLQIVADVTGRTLESVPDPQEASAVGAALIGAVGLGLYPNVESVKSFVPAGHVVKPDPAPRATYDGCMRPIGRCIAAARTLSHTNRSH
jgi:xylulokinase